MRAKQQPFLCHAFEGACTDLDVEHRLIKPRHPWNNGQVERMNRTIKEASVRRHHHQTHDQLRQHLTECVAAYTFARRLKTLRGPMPYEAICKAWTDDPSRFIPNPHHQSTGSNTEGASFLTISIGAVAVVDKSWGTSSPSTDVRVRSNLGPDQRAAERMQAREMRARERADATERRSKERAGSREAEAQERERARVERREGEQRVASGDPHAAAAARRRGSGRKDVVREQRDTRSYTTLVDVDRIRVLATRGASLAGLAGAFGISVGEVERALADAD